MAIDKGVWTWTGFSGAPGYSVFYATPDVGLSGVIKTFFEAVKGYIPSGDRLNELSGQLTGSWTGGVGGITTGTASGSWAAATGVAIQWNTDGVVNGRRVRGRTFLVPLHGGSYDTSGTIATAAQAALQAAANALVTSAAGDLLIWHRPKAGGGGSVHPVVSAVVPDRVAVLRSRRD